MGLGILLQRSLPFGVGLGKVGAFWGCREGEIEGGKGTMLMLGHGVSEKLRRTQRQEGKDGKKELR